MRKQRRSVPQNQRVHASRMLATQLKRQAIVQRSESIACYLAQDGEISLDFFISDARKMGKKIYLPIIDRLYQTHLWFAPYTTNALMDRNCFGIGEPVHHSSQRLRARNLDLILLPLVAFDSFGNRLGMGGGFYDKTLAYLLRRDHWLRPRLIGIAYDFQRLPRLPERPWDVRLHQIVTERHCYLCQ